MVSSRDNSVIKGLSGISQSPDQGWQQIFRRKVVFKEKQIKESLFSSAQGQIPKPPSSAGKLITS